MSDLEVTTKTITQYRFRTKQFGWAEISIDNNTLSIRSDWGTWSYYWCRSGCDFVEFLCKLDKDYFLGKLGRRDSVCEHKSAKAIKNYVITTRRDKSIPKEFARDLYDRTLEVIEWLEHGQQFDFDISDNFDVGELYDLIEKDFSSDLLMFYECAWLPFKEWMKQNLIKKKEEVNEVI